MSAIYWTEERRDKLVSVLENAGARITPWMYNALYVRVNSLHINGNGQVCYLSFLPESTRVTELLHRYAGVIKEKFNYIIN